GGSPGAGGSDGGMGAGGAGTGGTGGAAGDGCLADSEHDTVFAIALEDLCLRAKYTAPFTVGSYTPPSWGRHGGPVTLVQAYAGPSPDDEITLTRWGVPTEATGELTTVEVVGPLATGASAGDPFFAGVAVDLPDTLLTLVGWADGSLSGKLVALDGSVVADSWDIAGYYWAAAHSDGTTARLLISALSAPLDGAVGSAGLYAGDWDASTPTDPSPTTVHTWGLANGPVALDGAGNAFAVMTDYLSGNQSLRGFAAASVAPGAIGATGTELWDIPGFGSSLAAVHLASDGGWVFYQPQTFVTEVESGDVMGQRYGDGGGAVSPIGGLVPALTFVEANTEVTLMSDPTDRLWVGVAGENGSTFYVLGAPD
ncbi:MAG: hypothetical protein KC731_21375, partial [Myxococcales bacterium]|nr:hypothetical protein [Myxococcales bacterium]